MVRYFVIVGQRESSLLDYLERRFAGDATVQVVTDRRRGERRREARLRKPERRDRERREETGVVRLPGLVLARPASVPATAPEPSRKVSMGTEGRLPIEASGTTSAASAPTARTEFIRQVEKRRSIFELIPRMLDELVATEQECEELRQALAASMAEQDRLRSERADLAEALSKLMTEMTRPMHELAEKLRLTSQNRD